MWSSPKSGARPVSAYLPGARVPAVCGSVRFDTLSRRVRPQPLAARGVMTMCAECRVAPRFTNGPIGAQKGHARTTRSSLRPRGPSGESGLRGDCPMSVAVGAADERRGLIVADHTLRFGVEGERTLRPRRDVPEVTKTR